MGTQKNKVCSFVGLKQKTVQQFPIFPGGASRDRTGDLLHAMQALSQLSYGPEGLERQLY